MTNVPRSVQNQADAAEKLRSETYNPEPAPEPKPEPQPAEEPKPSESPKPAEETRDAAYWQHRFEVLQGKYNAEVREVPALRQKIADLEKQLEQAKQGQAEPSQDVQAALMKGLPDEVVEEYGPDLIRSIATIVSNAKAPDDSAELQQLRQEVESLKQDKTEDATAKFWADLETAVPNWRQIQSSQAAQDWLLAYDQQTGQKRDHMLQNAAANLQTQTVIKMFKDMKAVVDGGSRMPPEETIQPETNRSTTQAPADGKTYTRADINQFYRDKSQGKYTEEQAANIEKDIFAAQTEGRIRG